MSAHQPDVPAADAVPDGPQITETDCVRCGTRLAGLDGRYSCGICGWTNPWSEGYRALPTAEDDVDYPGRTGAGKTKAPAAKRRGPST